MRGSVVNSDSFIHSLFMLPRCTIHYQAELLFYSPVEPFDLASPPYLDGWVDLFLLSDGCNYSLLSTPRLTSKLQTKI
ncbi:MAG: hypothetical protein NT096_10815 [Proteobacteria bacterium]|nr:hypothetical protein [Pseudomonadota bacterium]